MKGVSFDRIYEQFYVTPIKVKCVCRIESIGEIFNGKLGTIE